MILIERETFGRLIKNEHSLIQNAIVVGIHLRTEKGRYDFNL